MVLGQSAIDSAKMFQSTQQDTIVWAACVTRPINGCVTFSRSVLARGGPLAKPTFLRVQYVGDCGHKTNLDKF